MYLQRLLRFYRQEIRWDRAVGMSRQYYVLMGLFISLGFGGYLSWFVWQQEIAAVGLACFAFLFWALGVRARNHQLAMATLRPVASYADRVVALLEVKHAKLHGFLSQHGLATAGHIDGLVRSAQFLHSREEESDKRSQRGFTVFASFLTGLVLLVARNALQASAVDGVNIVKEIAAIASTLFGLWVGVGRIVQDVLRFEQRQLEEVIALLLDVRITVHSAETNED